MRSFRRYITAPLGRLLKRLMQAGLRHLFRTERTRRRLSRAGFVFPTTMLLLLVVALTAGALTYRAYSRSESAILARQQQVIDNAATPSIDRAKAKIEYLFSNDTRSPRKVPTSDQLKTMLLGDQEDLSIEIVREAQDIYTLEDETRLDLDGDGTNDNAWYFPTGVGDQVVVYSITVDDANAGEDIDNPVSMAKAEAQVTRNGPISTSEAPAACISVGGGDVGQRSEEGWQIVSPSTVEKNIQVNAFVADLNDISGTATTLEFQQVREGDRASKWGAWFRYDLEAFPGPTMPWNGAMHTQGSYIFGGSFQSYMISSKSSCLYGPGASEMTVGRDISDTGFHGQLVFRDGGDSFIDFDQANGIGTENVEADVDSIVETANGDATTTGGDVAAQNFREGIQLNPIKLYLSDISEHIDETAWNSVDPNPTDDEEGRLKRFDNFNGRVQEVDPKLLKNLSLDDVFRADNRWGPRSSYTAEGEVKIDVPGDIGVSISGNATLTNSQSGLDGYWERQATSQGTRFIVGERLELGNAHGWNYDPTGSVTPKKDSLYPPDLLPTNTETNNGGRRQFGVAEQKQRRTLRDNLAAVQGMVVYRWDLGSGTVPQACIAVTAHHGTAKAVADSRTFRQRSDDNTLVMTDFLTGQGTDGWEFNVVGSGTGNMGSALSNLANFAGDPLGGAPSFEPTQDSNVHPYPYMAMWGDQALLRRVLASGNGSVADTSTVDTASCTLSLLAYNIKAIRAEHSDIADSDWSTLAPKLTTAYAADNTLKDQDYTAWQAVGGITADEQTFIEKAHRYWEIQRDRETGFAMGVGIASAATQPTGWNGTYDASAGTYTLTAAVGNYVAGTYDLTANPYIFNGSDYGTLTEENALSLALAVSPKPSGLHRYPALYYIFPSIAHNQDGSTGGPVQPANEPYILQTVATYAQNNSFSAFTEAEIDAIAATPKAIGGTGWTLPTSSSSLTSLFETDPAAWAASSASTDYIDTSSGTPNAVNAFSLVVANSAGVFSSSFDVSVLDKIMYSGRENMAIRVLDMDVARLMANNWFYGKDIDGVEHFGLTYAFREDAVREDEIVRPSAGGDSATCNTYAVLGAWGTNANCHMQIDTNPLLSKDPPLASKKLSAKPVDYRPDPDRRPYGFRLRNGANFGRAGDVQSGLSFITDNSLVIQGDFNLHGGGNLEEFSDFLLKTDGFGQFYNRNTLNLGNFANSTNDTWRPAEVLADAVYIHSDNFKDGFVEAAYTNVLGVSGGNGQGKVSFENMNILGDNNRNRPGPASVLREDGNTGNQPVYFDRNGEAFDTNSPVRPLAKSSTGTGSSYYYWGFRNSGDWQETRTRNLIDTDETIVNVLLISGTIPSRPTQPYGGLHNFPRLHEYWTGDNLYMSGGFYQLFFSHSATAPFNANTWEPGDLQRVNAAGDVVGVANINYYTPPNRRWGYDVALQYSPPHPISLRFISVGDARSEFYRELPVDDPYIQVLRCAKKPDNAQIDPSANCA